MSPRKLSVWSVRAGLKKVCHISSDGIPLSRIFIRVLVIEQCSHGSDKKLNTAILPKETQ